MRCPFRRATTGTPTASRQRGGLGFPNAHGTVFPRRRSRGQIRTVTPATTARSRRDRPVGLVGAGGVGARHARTLAGFDDVDLVGICDPVAASAEALAGGWTPATSTTSAACSPRAGRRLVVRAAVRARRAGAVGRARAGSRSSSRSPGRRPGRGRARGRGCSIRLERLRDRLVAKLNRDIGLHPVGVSTGFRRPVEEASASTAADRYSESS